MTGKHWPPFGSKEFVDRFWSYTELTNAGCRLWSRSLDLCGYGVLCIRKYGASRAHRVAWELCRGSIPLDLEVCHRCDIPACCNPRHLFLDTHSGNIRDAVSKGRVSVVGDRNPRARLSREQVEIIRRVPKYRGVNVELARRFKVSHVTISHVRRGYTWNGSAV